MPREEEEFELVLGNKQLLSLFFVVVVFFAAFFSVGYTVGFNHGETTQSSPLAKADIDPPPLQDEIVLPETLLKDAPGTEPTPTPPQAKATPKPAPKSAETAKAEPVKADPKPAPFRQETEAKKPAPVQRTAAPRAKPPAAASSGPSYHLQVAALRVQKDAELLAGKLKAKGYPAMVDTGAGDGWIRVVVGPFSGADAAKEYRTKLRGDGFDTMLRKR